MAREDVKWFNISSDQYSKKCYLLKKMARNWLFTCESTITFFICLSHISLFSRVLSRQCSAIKIGHLELLLKSDTSP